MRQFLTWLLDMPLDLQRQASSPMASLERSISAAHHAHTAARRALAVALAEETRESVRRTALATKAADLEQRAVAALKAGREDLAVQAAEMIAAMATDINASERASTRFAAEVTLARREVDQQRRRLSELDRGHRLARIGQALSATALSATAPTSHGGLDHLSEAEAALARSQPTITTRGWCARNWRLRPNISSNACRTPVSASRCMFAPPTCWRGFAPRPADGRFHI
jgi:phage shock protein A